MNWRVIPMEAHDAFTNMAIDEAILEGLSNSTSIPTIRFYTWKPSAVSIGRFQSLSDEVDVEKCKELGVDVVRRLTGGGAVYHDQEGEITYSILAPEDTFAHGIHESYREICACVMRGLENAEISNATFAPINDIVVDGKKISGNAQMRRSGMLLQHGTVLYKTNIERMFSVLKISDEKISDKMIKSVEERVTSVARLKEISKGALYHALLMGFTEGKEYSTGALSVDEKTNVETLTEHYRSDEWNLLR